MVHALASQISPLEKYRLKKNPQTGGIGPMTYVFSLKHEEWATSLSHGERGMNLESFLDSCISQPFLLNSHENNKANWYFDHQLDEKVNLDGKGKLGKTSLRM